MGCAPAAAAWRKCDLPEVSLDLQSVRSPLSPLLSLPPEQHWAKWSWFPSDLGCLHLQELQVNLERVTPVMQNHAKSWLHRQWEMQMRWQFLEAKFRHLSTEETQCYIPDPSRHSKECRHGQGTTGLSDKWQVPVDAAGPRGCKPGHTESWATEGVWAAAGENKKKEYQLQDNANLQYLSMGN